MRRIGVTGHREQMTVAEHAKLVEWFLVADAECWAEHDARPILHHGDCLGVDAAAHEIAAGLEWDIIVHPPTDSRYRAYCTAGRTTILDPKPYLQRNTDIADSVDRLFACPSSKVAVLRSGTWSTIRRAERRHLPIEVF